MPDRDVPTVTVCRGCCCGTPKKRPGVDHEARLEALRALLGDGAIFRVTGEHPIAEKESQRQAPAAE